MTAPTGARRLPAALAVLLLPLVALGLLVLVPAAPAGAAGTGGIEVTPIPGVVDGRQVTAFHVKAPGEGETLEVPFALRNVTRETRSARLYVASARKQRDGSFTVGPAGSSDHAALPEETVELRGDALERRSFTVRGAVEEQEYAAVVVEVRSGNVVQRAATLVYLQPGPPVSVPLALALGAALLLALAGAGVAVARRRAA